MVDIRVSGGCLCGVPSDEDGPLLIPFGEGTSWCATVTGKASEFDRHFWARPRPRREGRLYIVPAHARPGVVLEFGVNDRRPGPQDQEPEHVAGVLVAVAHARKRRWYGVIAELSAERLRLAPCADLKAAFSVAISYEAEPILPHLREQIAGMVTNIKGGALMELGVLADLLDDLSDPRGARIREDVAAALDGLFPECKQKDEEQEKKST